MCIRDSYYPAFLVDKVKDGLQKVIALLESGETDTEVVQELSLIHIFYLCSGLSLLRNSAA